MVEASAALLKPMAEQRQIELTCELQTAQVAGDVERLAQVVANLVNNAITYNRAGGQVRLHLAAKEHHAVLTVSDTGIGIEENNLPRICERFFRVDRARTGNGNAGVGLGLAICQEIVHAHGGTINVSSKLGEGSTFTVRLPLWTLGSK